MSFNAIHENKILVKILNLQYMMYVASKQVRFEDPGTVEHNCLSSSALGELHIFKQFYT